MHGDLQTQRNTKQNTEPRTYVYFKRHARKYTLPSHDLRTKEGKDRSFSLLLPSYHWENRQAEWRPGSDWVRLDSTKETGRPANPSDAHRRLSSPLQPLRLMRSSCFKGPCPAGKLTHPQAAAGGEGLGLPRTSISPFLRLRSRKPSERRRV